MIFYVLQKYLENNTKKVNISSLPIIIVRDRTHLAAFGRGSYVPDGPIMCPKPGPTFEIAEAEAEIEVKKSIPIEPSNIALKAKRIIYKKKKPITEVKASSFMVFLLKVVIKTPWG